MDERWKLFFLQSVSLIGILKPFLNIWFCGQTQTNSQIEVDYYQKLRIFNGN